MEEKSFVSIGRAPPLHPTPAPKISGPLLAPTLGALRQAFIAAAAADHASPSCREMAAFLASRAGRSD
jgi:hypothetical protein